MHKFKIGDIIVSHYADQANTHEIVEILSSSYLVTVDNGNGVGTLAFHHQHLYHRLVYYTVIWRELNV
jgi:hypothetical protein